MNDCDGRVRKTDFILKVALLPLSSLLSAGLQSWMREVPRGGPGWQVIKQGRTDLGAPWGSD